MALEGDIIEYHDMGPVLNGPTEDGGIDAAAIELLINFMEFAWTQWSYTSVMRLNGGGRSKKELILRNPETNVVISEDGLRIGNLQFTREDLSNAYRGARRVYTDLVVPASEGVVSVGKQVYTSGKRAYDDFVGGVGEYFGNKRPNDETRLVPWVNNTRPFNNTNTTTTTTMTKKAKNMLDWKNTLTRMYHTYHRYVMSPIIYKTTKTSGGTTFYLHNTTVGTGPGLYWTYSNTTGVSTREVNWNTMTYWDGGMAFPPSNSPTQRNYGLGSGGSIYVFAADWPGTIMNPDPDTHPGGTGLVLQMTNYEYNQVTENKNIPRKWDDTFNNTSWNYITVYGCEWRFEFTNFAPQLYCVEISLFAFKADVDAMDYEKHCLAHFGGAQGGTNAYKDKLLLSPVTDVSVIKTRRFLIPGMVQNLWNSSSNQIIGTEVNNHNRRIVKWTLKHKYVLKRPVLTSYETNLTEKDIWEKYHDDQKGLYFRVQAWPMTLDMQVNNSTGEVTSNGTQEKCTPVTAIEGGKISPCVQCVMYKKTWYKMDENSPTF